jgi:hypothetical protein
MAHNPWVIVFMVIAVLARIGWVVGAIVLRRRKRLATMTRPSSHPDPTVEVDRIVGGSTQQAIDHPHDNGR